MRSTERYAHSEDAALLALANEDEQALATLYDRYGALVYGTTRRLVGDPHVAEEVVQDVFVSAWRSAGSYRRERGSVATWLLAIARNRAIDATRRRAARPVDPYDDLWATEESEDTAELVSAADESRRVASAMSELPDTQREALLLAYVAGLSHAEIAARLGVPVGTVKGRIRLALDRLRKVAPQYALGAEPALR